MPTNSSSETDARAAPPDTPPFSAEPPAGATAREDAHAAGTDPPGLPSFKTLLDVMQDAAGQYVAARLDLVKLKARKVVWALILGVVASIIGGAVLLTAAVLAVLGAAGALADLLNAPSWAGQLIVGALVLILTFLGLVLVKSKGAKAAREKMEARYESRKNRQRARFGADFSREPTHVASD